MLPFLQKLKYPGGSSEVISRKPDEEKSQDNHGLDSCAQQLIDAIHNKDVNMVAQALKDAFTICESQPHEEYSQEDSE